MRAICGIRPVLFAATTIAINCLAQPPNPASGRWEGTVDVPGRPFTLVVDLSPDDAGHWIGSATVPGFHVKGAPLSALSVEDKAIAFTIRDALGSPTVKARLSDEGMSGDFALAGDSAHFTLHRTGAPQVDLPPKSTLVQHELEGEWGGAVMYLNREFRLKLTLANGEGAASAKMVLSRDKDFPLPIGLIQQDDSSLTMKTTDGQINVDAVFDRDKGEIRGTMEIGGVDVAMVLRKAGAK